MPFHNEITKKSIAYVLDYKELTSKKDMDDFYNKLISLNFVKCYPPCPEDIGIREDSFCVGECWECWNKSRENYKQKILKNEELLKIAMEYIAIKGGKQ